jgi:hypothetical protein
VTFRVDQPQQIQELLSDRRIRLKGKVPKLLGKNIRRAVRGNIEEVRSNLAIALPPDLHPNAEFPVYCSLVVTRHPLQKPAASYRQGVPVNLKRSVPNIPHTFPLLAEK